MNTISVLIILLSFGTSFYTGWCFEKDAFCKAACARGRGGLLCSCNVVHFAGKRARIVKTDLHMQNIRTIWDNLRLSGGLLGLSRPEEESAERRKRRSNTWEDSVK